MTKKKIYKHTPDYVILPGVSIIETCAALNLTPGMLAKKMDLPDDFVNLVIEGEYQIDPVFASKLNKITGVPASFWINLQENYNSGLKHLGLSPTALPLMIEMTKASKDKASRCVHTEHCCKRHGCKYGDSDCPVENGLKVQSGYCERCSWEIPEEIQKG